MTRRNEKKQKDQKEQMNSKKQTDQTVIKELESKQSGGKIISFLTIALSVLSLGLGIANSLYQNSMTFNNSNLMISRNVQIEATSKSYTAEFKIEQGSIKKLYVAVPENGGIIFKDEYDNEIVVENDMKKFRITRNLDVASTKLRCNYSDEKNNAYDIYKKLDISDISQFAIVIQDRTNQWNIYYCIVQPEINPESLAYKLQLEDNTTGTILAEGQKDLDKRESKEVIIFGEITNKETIQEKIENAEFGEDYYFFKENMVLSDGETSSNPKVEIAYHIPSAEDVLNNLEKIYKAISQFK